MSSSKYKVNYAFVKRLYKIFVLSTKPCSAAFILFLLLVPICLLEQVSIFNCTNESIYINDSLIRKCSLKQFILNYIHLYLHYYYQVGIYFVGLLPSGFYHVLESKDSNGFKSQLVVYVEC